MCNTEKNEDISRRFESALKFNGQESSVYRMRFSFDC